MSQNITPVTVAAMRKVFALLEDNFDAKAGQYLAGYSDERIAKETGISVEGVKKYRVDGFGKLQPPSELHQLKQQLSELETLFLQTENDMKAQIKDIKQRILNLQKKFD